MVHLKSVFTHGTIVSETGHYQPAFAPLTFIRFSWHTHLHTENEINDENNKYVNDQKVCPQRKYMYRVSIFVRRMTLRRWLIITRPEIFHNSLVLVLCASDRHSYRARSAVHRSLKRTDGYRRKLDRISSDSAAESASTAAEKRCNFHASVPPRVHRK